MIDLVTVVYRQELKLLEIQAKSIEQYFPENLLNRILVTVNDDIDVVSFIDANWWGKYKDRVQIFHKYNFSHSADQNIGWESQQLFKMLTSTTSSSQLTCVLDAKTWFVRDVLPQQIFNDNKINVALMPLFDGFKNSSDFLTKLFNLEYRHIIGPGGVPFYFHNETLRNMVNYINDNVEPFDKFFCSNAKDPNNITEFTLYSAYVLAHNKFNEIYSGKQTYNVVNIAHFEIDLFDDIFKNMQNPLVLTVSIHLAVYKQINESQFLDWCNFLTTKKLFPATEIAKNQLNTLRTGVDNGLGIRL